MIDLSSVNRFYDAQIRLEDRLIGFRFACNPTESLTEEFVSLDKQPGIEVAFSSSRLPQKIRITGLDSRQVAEAIAQGLEKSHSLKVQRVFATIAPPKTVDSF